MKKRNFLVVTVLLFLIVSSCNGKSDTTDNSHLPTDSININTEKPTEEINQSGLQHITLNEKNFYNVDISGNHAEVEYWQQIVSEHFGISIKVSDYSKYLSLDSIQAAVMSKQLQGIGGLYDGLSLDDCIKLDLILPLDELLADNEIWKYSVPLEWKEAFNIDNKVWAIPSGTDKMIYWVPRLMRTDWLASIKAVKPNTIDEFYEVSRLFTYEDPDGNNRNDTSGFGATGLYGIHDIFQSFDCRLGFIDKPGPAWNLNTGAWEDSMLKTEMLDCLAFLSKCYSENILNNSMLRQTKLDKNDILLTGIAGSTCISADMALDIEGRIQANVKNFKVTCIGALKHNISKNINTYRVPLGVPRVLFKSTEKPKETINWYLNTFYGDSWGHFTAMYGPIGIMNPSDEEMKNNEFFDMVRCRIGSSDVTLRISLEDGTIKPFPMVSYVGDFSSNDFRKSYSVSYIAWNSGVNYGEFNPIIQYRQKIRDDISRQESWRNEFINSQLMTKIPYKMDIWYQPYSDESLKEFHEKSTGIILNAIEGNVSPEDAVARYRELAMIYGLQTLLEELNQKLGKDSTQKY
ncbi:MAG: hypothetical protein KAH14_02010 [Clostridiales bacterium]|nr:hypothetical protein [Clostridiales bacterium]